MSASTKLRLKSSTRSASERSDSPASAAAGAAGGAEEAAVASEAIAAQPACGPPNLIYKSSPGVQPPMSAHSPAMQQDLSKLPGAGGHCTSASRGLTVPIAKARYVGLGWESNDEPPAPTPPRKRRRRGGKGSRPPAGARTHEIPMPAGPDQASPMPQPTTAPSTSPSAPDEPPPTIALPAVTWRWADASPAQRPALSSSIVEQIDGLLYCLFGGRL